jgi:alpha-mannosidase
MPTRSWHGATTLFSVLAFVLCWVNRLEGQHGISGDTSTKPDAYIVPFSHLDRFWGGTGEECLARGNRIISKAIKISEQYPEFRFLIESDNFLANFVETHAGSPELQHLKSLVKEGRIEIAPNWTNLFLNLPDGEVLTRNVLYGRLYARTVFGVDPPVYHSTDIPGFTPQFPQILHKTGTPFMTMTRMGPDKSLFNWTAPEGSKALVWNAHGYGWGASLHLHDDLTDEQIANIKKQIEERQRIGTPRVPVYIHLGVDLWAPTEKTIQNVHALNKVSSPGFFTMSTSKEFFNAVADTPDLKELSGEIPMSWPHVVDGILHLWQLAPLAMSALETAEQFAAINYALGYAEYPQGDFEVLWKRLIESMDHNHDGQGGEIGDNRKMEYSQLAMTRGGEILRNMLRNIAERVRIPIADSVPIVVFSGLGWPRDDVVKTHLTIYGDVVPSRIDDFRKGMRLVDETGKSVPFHVLQTSENISRAVDLIFVAQSVPALGYKTYFLTPADQTETFPAASQVTLDRDQDMKDPRRPLGSDVIENQFYRLTVDKATGGVSVFDKQLNRDVSKDMQVVGVEERGSNNVQPEKDTGRTFPMTVTGTTIEENNGVRTVFRIRGILADIPIVQRLILYSFLKRLDIENSLDWQEQRLLRIQQQFPIPQPNAQVVYGIPFGANAATNIMPGSGPDSKFSPSMTDEVNKKAWDQYRVIQDWIFAGTSESGVTVAANHQLVRLSDGMIAANMIRGQRYTSVKIVGSDEVTSIHFPPNGRYVFNYSFTSGPGDWKTAHSYQAGRSLNHPLLPVSVIDEISAKSLPPTNSFFSVQADDLVLSAVKKSESDRSVILRLYEIQGAKAETPVFFLGKQQDFRETDLLERELRPSEQRVLRVNPYEIKTIKLRTETQTGQKSLQ